MIPATHAPMQTNIAYPVIVANEIWHANIVRIIANPNDTILVRNPQAMKAPPAIIAVQMPGITYSGPEMNSECKKSKPKHIRIEPNTRRNVHWRRESLVLVVTPRSILAVCLRALIGFLAIFGVLNISFGMCMPAGVQVGLMEMTP